MIASIETVQSQAYDGIRFEMLKPVIEKLCQICGIEVDFVPYGLAGDVFHCAIKCHYCKRTFHVRLSPFNESNEHCPHCGCRHYIGNDWNKAWIINDVEMKGQ